MSYSVYAYLVDFNRLKASYGSNDARLLATIENTFGERISEFDTCFQDDVRRSGLSLREAVADLIQGNISTPSAAWEYAYALELLCLYFGQRLPNDEFESMNAAALEILQRLSGVGDLLFRSGAPVPIPTPRDFPVVGHNTEEAAKRNLEDGGPAPTPGPWQEWQADLIERYVSWLEAAAEAQRGIVTLLY